VILTLLCAATAGCCTHTQVFWGLDKKLAQRKHFPSVNWLISYTKYMRVLEPFFNDYNPDYGALRNKCRDILQQEDALSEIVQLVGRDSLSEDQKVVMEIARVIREDFLQQNAFTDYDYTCPLYKSLGMLKTIITFYNTAQKTIADSPAEARITWAHIKTTMQPLLSKVVDGKFVDPKMPRGEMDAHYNKVCEEIEEGFQSLSEV
jgi:V-type H+-transporting ATPase subunit A